MKVPAERKVIQIATVGIEYSGKQLIVLCDDGSIWARYLSEDHWFKIHLPPGCGANNPFDE